MNDGVIDYSEFIDYCGCTMRRYGYLVYDENHKFIGYHEFNHNKFQVNGIIQLPNKDVCAYLDDYLIIDKFDEAKTFNPDYYIYVLIVRKIK